MQATEKCALKLRFNDRLGALTPQKAAVAHFHRLEDSRAHFWDSWGRRKRGSAHNVLIDVAPRPGLEPGTCGLIVRPVNPRKTAPGNDPSQNGQ
jgi:hypothetical protein